MGKEYFTIIVRTYHDKTLDTPMILKASANIDDAYNSLSYVKERLALLVIDSLDLYHSDSIEVYEESYLASKEQRLDLEDYLSFYNRLIKEYTAYDDVSL